MMVMRCGTKWWLEMGVCLCFMMLSLYYNHDNNDMYFELAFPFHYYSLTLFCLYFFATRIFWVFIRIDIKIMFGDKNDLWFFISFFFLYFFNAHIWIRFRGTGGEIIEFDLCWVDLLIYFWVFVLIQKYSVTIYDFWLEKIIHFCSFTLTAKSLKF